jgi:hypothetical protein
MPDARPRTPRTSAAWLAVALLRAARTRAQVGGDDFDDGAKNVVTWGDDDLSGQGVLTEVN